MSEAKKAGPILESIKVIQSLLGRTAWMDEWKDTCSPWRLRFSLPPQRIQERPFCWKTGHRQAGKEEWTNEEEEPARQHDKAKHSLIMSCRGDAFGFIESRNTAHQLCQSGPIQFAWWWWIYQVKKEVEESLKECPKSVEILAIVQENAEQTNTKTVMEKEKAHNWGSIATTVKFIGTLQENVHKMRSLVCLLVWQSMKLSARWMTSWEIYTKFLLLRHGKICQGVVTGKRQLWHYKVDSPEEAVLSDLCEPSDKEDNKSQEDKWTCAVAEEVPEYDKSKAGEPEAEE